MKCVRAKQGKLWHKLWVFQWRGLNRRNKDFEFIPYYTGQAMWVGELVDECHLPKDARLCKRCFFEKRK
jgi:hypothetical protein